MDARLAATMDSWMKTAGIDLLAEQVVPWQINVSHPAGVRRLVQDGTADLILR